MLRAQQSPAMHAIAFFQNLFRGPDLIILVVIVLVIALIARAGRGNAPREK